MKIYTGNDWTPGRCALNDLAPTPFGFTRAERRLIARLKTPTDVQRYLNALPYNTEPPPGRATLRSFRGVVRHHTTHCLEAALAAAVILEQHGYPPLVMSFESIDELDHVIFVYQKRGQWGSVARGSRVTPALHGRKPVFHRTRARAQLRRSAHRLPGRITGCTVVDLRDLLGDYDWRLSRSTCGRRNASLLDAPHRPIRESDARIDARRKRYVAFVKTHGRKPLFYNRRAWTELPQGNW